MPDTEMQDAMALLHRRLPTHWWVVSNKRLDGLLCVEVEGPGAAYVLCGCGAADCHKWWWVATPMTISCREESPGALVEQLVRKVYDNAAPGGRA
jgi:hypothetical protein